MARPAAVGENVPRLPGSKPSILSMPQPGTPSTVEVGVDGAPRGASAWDGDRRLEIPLRLAAGSGAHRVTFRADGYKDLILEIPAEAGKRVSLKAMQRLPPPRATRRAPSPAPPPAARHQPPPRPQPAQPPPKQQPADGPRKRQAPRPRNEDIL
jgi:hypothetical protein